MRPLKIVPGGERGWRSPAGGPAFRVPVDRPGSVLRRSGRRLAEHYPQWGDPVRRRIDWRMWAFFVGWAVVFGVLVYFGLERMA